MPTPGFKFVTRMFFNTFSNSPNFSFFHYLALDFRKKVRILDASGVSYRKDLEHFKGFFLVDCFCKINSEIHISGY